MSRIAARFSSLQKTNRKAFIPFISAGDPNLDVYAQLLEKLPHAGADLIEIGMPFSDPMADGPAIERANLRAFAAGITLKKIIASVGTFRSKDDQTPVILMGYINPILSYGIEKFMGDAKQAGVDGLIIADVPPEEEAEIRIPAQKQDIDIIRLITPTTDAKRLPTVLKGASGFLYCVSVTGITGSKQANSEIVRNAVDAIRPQSNLPIAVGFGITTPEQANAIAKISDGVVVGSAIVNRIAANLDYDNWPKAGLIDDVVAFVKSLASAVHLP